MSKKKEKKEKKCGYTLEIKGEIHEEEGSSSTWNKRRRKSKKGITTWKTRDMWSVKRWGNHVKLEERAWRNFKKRKEKWDNHCTWRLEVGIKLEASGKPNGISAPFYNISTANF
jgi:hypothetical protein